jgi:broad specificity phosphatase PhoE
MTTDPFLFLVRHGQCVSNLTQGFAVAEDAEDLLTPLGEHQAVLAGRELAALLHGAALSSPVVVSSALLRAEQTADLLVTEIDHAERLDPDPRWNEKSADESPEDVMVRVGDALAELQGGDGRPCVVVTHGHVLQFLVCQLLQVTRPWPTDGPSSVHPINGGITVLRGGELVAFNLLSHLVREGAVSPPAGPPR